MKLGNIRYLAKKLDAEGSKKKFAGFTRIFAFVSIMLGSAALIISLSVLDGFESELRKTAVKFTSHITLQGFDSRRIENYPKIINDVTNKFPEIISANPVIQKEALIRGKNGTDGIVLKGISADNISQSDISNSLVKGEFDISSKSIVIGKALAEKIGADTGSNILIYNIDFQSGINSAPQYKQFKVSGIYETGMMQYDETLAFIDFYVAKELSDTPDNNCTHIEFMLEDFNYAPELSLMIDDFVGFPYFTLTVFDMHAAIFAWIGLQKEPIPLVLGLITLVAVMNIITSVLVLIVEKTYSIGILRTLGIRNSDLLKIFILKGMKTGVLGSLTGSLVAFVLLMLQKHFELIRLKGEIYFLTTAPVEISIWHYIVVFGVSFILTFAVTLVPALITLKISPLKAIRFR